MANKVYRWVGSGNTGSTQADIFSWNTPGNWQVLKYFGNGLSGGWQFAYSNIVPGPLDTAIFGIPNNEIVGGYPLNHLVNLTPVKSPCLFGGYAGTVAGGTWANSGDTGSAAGGTTYQSGLKSLFVRTDQFTAVQVPTGRTYGTYNDTAYAFTKPLPLGGGLTGSDACKDILEWIQLNYPNMGVTVNVGATTGQVTYSIPAGFTNSWENLNVKVYNTIDIDQNGGSGLTTSAISFNTPVAYPSSPIKLKVVKAFSPVSGNMGATTGLTGINAPVVKTTLKIKSARNVDIDGGAYETASAIPYAAPALAAGGGGYDYVTPAFNFDNMSVMDFELSSICDNQINTGVKFGDLEIRNAVIVPGYFNNKNIYSATAQRGTYINGQNVINTVFTEHYPGNTANVSNSEGQVFLNMTTSRSYGNQFVTNTPIQPNAYNYALKNIALDHMSDGGLTNPAHDYFKGIFTNNWGGYYLGDGSVVGSHSVIINQGGITSTVNIERIVAVGNGVEETPIVTFSGGVNVNKIVLNNGARASFYGHIGNANIGNVQIDGYSVLDMRNPLNHLSQIFFGQFSSSGVCGGVENYSSSGPPESPRSNGKILLEEGERLFNVSTSKKGLLARSAETAIPVDSISPIIATKS
jgi:hypothetical protein